MYKILCFEVYILYYIASPLINDNKTRQGHNWNGFNARGRRRKKLERASSKTCNWDQLIEIYLFIVLYLE